MNEDVSMVLRLRYDEERKRSIAFADFSYDNQFWTYSEDDLPSPLNEEDTGEFRERAWAALVDHVSVH
jgi:hypothetical protein